MVSTFVRFPSLHPRSLAPVFLLFEEPTGGYKIPAGAPEYGVEWGQRRNWDALAFAEKHGLKLVGANYFLAGDPVSVVVS
jgi:hypothetical protein